MNDFLSNKKMAIILSVLRVVFIIIAIVLPLFNAFFIAFFNTSAFKNGIIYVVKEYLKRPNIAAPWRDIFYFYLLRIECLGETWGYYNGVSAILIDGVWFNRKLRPISAMKFVPRILQWPPSFARALQSQQDFRKTWHRNATEFGGKEEKQVNSEI